MFLVTLAQARAFGSSVYPAADGRAHPRFQDSISIAGSLAGGLFCEGSTK